MSMSGHRSFIEDIQSTGQVSILMYEEDIDKTKDTTKKGDKTPLNMIQMRMNFREPKPKPEPQSEPESQTEETK